MLASEEVALPAADQPFCDRIVQEASGVCPVRKLVSVADQGGLLTSGITGGSLWDPLLLAPSKSSAVARDMVASVVSLDMTPCPSLNVHSSSTFIHPEKS